MVVLHCSDPELLYRFVEKENFTALDTKTVYEKARFKRSKPKQHLTFYNTGTIQLVGEDTERTVHKMESSGIAKAKEKIHFRKELGNVIGTDESLKGDTFGGIVVAAVKGNDVSRRTLLELGVSDSKLLKDSHIIGLAQRIKQEVECSIITLTPSEYNQFNGVTKVLNTLHEKTAKALGGGTHVVDKYPGCLVGDIRETKAELKYVEVAAASVLARAAALEQINNLSRQAGFRIPKGSTHVQWALQELLERGHDPKLFVKLHFKNVQGFLRNH